MKNISFMGGGTVDKITFILNVTRVCCFIISSIRNLRDELRDRQSQQSKLENELRHTQTQIYDLEHDLEKRKLECVRLENEWEAYKLRVKSMLFSKDNEIKALRDGSNLSEDTKQLIEQIDSLK